MNNTEIFIGYTKNIFPDAAGYKIKLTSEFIYEIMDSSDFENYLKYGRTKPLKIDNVSFYCLTRGGKKISPRWVLEYIYFKMESLFEKEENEKLLRYGHTDSAKKIFEALKIPILSK